MARIGGPDGSGAAPPGDDDRASTTRRGLLTSLIAALFAGTAATQALVGLGRADAAVTNLDVGGDSITTDDGQLTGLAASVSGHVSYDGLDTAASSVDVSLYAAPAGGDTTAGGNQIASTSATVADSTGLDPNAGHRDFGFSGVDVLAAADLSKNDFAANADGSTKDTDVDFRLAMAVEDSDGTELVSASATATATISVTNQANSGNANGNGNTNASGSNQSP